MSLSRQMSFIKKAPKITRIFGAVNASSEEPCLRFYLLGFVLFVHQFFKAVENFSYMLF